MSPLGGSWSDPGAPEKGVHVSAKCRFFAPYSALNAITSHGKIHYLLYDIVCVVLCCVVSFHQIRFQVLGGHSFLSNVHPWIRVRKEGLLAEHPSLGT